MIDPRQHIADVMDGSRLRHGRAIDHDDRQAERSRGVDLGAGTLPSRILCDDQIDAVIPHKGKVTRWCERATIHQQMVARQCGRRIWRIDEPQEIVMLWLRGEGFDMHPTESEHHAPRRAIERADGAGDIRDVGPAVAVHCLPFRAVEHQMGDIRSTRGGGGVGADRSGEGMGGVDKVGESPRLQERRQAVSAAKAADADRHRLCTGIAGAPGIAQRRLFAPLGQGSGERARFHGAAKDQDVAHGG